MQNGKTTINFNSYVEKLTFDDIVDVKIEADYKRKKILSVTISLPEWIKNIIGEDDLKDYVKEKKELLAKQDSTSEIKYY